MEELMSKLTINSNDTQDQLDKIKSMIDKLKYMNNKNKKIYIKYINKKIKNILHNYKLYNKYQII